jgi:hypothetical protein
MVCSAWHVNVEAATERFLAQLPSIGCRTLKGSCQPIYILSMNLGLPTVHAGCSATNVGLCRTNVPSGYPGLRAPAANHASRYLSPPS